MCELSSCFFMLISSCITCLAERQAEARKSETTEKVHRHSRQTKESCRTFVLRLKKFLKDVGNEECNELRRRLVLPPYDLAKQQAQGREGKGRGKAGEGAHICILGTIWLKPSGVMTSILAMTNGYFDAINNHNYSEVLYRSVRTAILVSHGE